MCTPTLLSKFNYYIPGSLGANLESLASMWIRHMWPYAGYQLGEWTVTAGVSFTLNHTTTPTTTKYANKV